MATAFLSEFLTSGAWPREQSIPASLVTEGRAMLESLLADLLNLPDMQVRLTWDQRLPPPDVLAPWVEGGAGPGTAVSVCHRVTLHWADDRSEPALRRSACESVDHVLLIAPEFDDILGRQVAEAAAHTQAELWNATPSAVRLCSDKLQLARHLQSRPVSVVPTRGVNEDLPDDWTDLIVKPRDGAGSQGIQRLARAGFNQWKQALSRRGLPADAWVAQPYTPGRTLSVAAIFGADGALHDVWPVAQQVLVPQTFAYLGGLIPAPRVNPSRIAALITNVAACVPGLRGYIGFDLIERPDGEVVVVEINPRLTTSYVGYRSLAGTSLAAWLQPQTQPRPAPKWTAQTIRFTAAGDVSLTPETVSTSD